MDKIPIGAWIQAIVDGLTERLGTQLSQLSDGLSAILQQAVEVLTTLNPAWFIGSGALLLFWQRRSWRAPVFFIVSFLLIINLGYWRETLETLVLVISATTVSVLVGVPIGIIAAHRPWVYRLLRPILDFMQTIPTFVYLIPTLMLFGLGLTPGLISTIVFAIPAPIRMTVLGITGVPQSLREVGLAFGANWWQRLCKIELPAARPLIYAGITQCIMLSLSMVVIAALVGADGIGKPIVQALNTVDVAKGFEAGLVIVILAIVLDRAVPVTAKRVA